MPWIDFFLRKNPIMLWLRARGLISNTTSPIALFAERLQPEKEHLSDNEDLGTDFLARFMREAKKDPVFMDDR